MHTDHLKIIGCGGHGRVVIDALSLCAHSFKISLCDSNKKLLGNELYGLLIDSTLESLADFKGFAHVSIGDNQIRQVVYKLLNLETTLLTIIHPAALISKYATIEPGSFIAAKAIIKLTCLLLINSKNRSLELSKFQELIFTPIYESTKTNLNVMKHFINRETKVTNP